MAAWFEKSMPTSEKIKYSVEYFCAKPPCKRELGDFGEKIYEKSLSMREWNANALRSFHCMQPGFFLFFKKE